MHATASDSIRAGADTRRSLRRRLGAVTTRRTDLRVRLARALFATNRSTEAASQARLALQQKPEVHDEFGTPLSLYAAELLMDREQVERVWPRLSALGGTPRWLTGGATLYLSQLTEGAACPASSALDELVAETRVAGGDANRP